ncbi:MAG TPA: GGDEF domain-containing protein [Aquabacterium sp.]|uniref:GGDEF domain-containing protein n=1 Tax=Aquabacterium sp. TaxID=1872578 RepID=UPI002E30B50C|nr:GGDEF domain-containing protein [Aquabacterium sp.]HEX5358150.1 GGDEF domain-containing protein [Aquabacterium sp.]
MYAPFISRLNDLLLTTDRKQRLRITRSLMAANVFIACCFLQVYAWWVGYMEMEDVKRLSGVILVNIVVWYLVLRTGLNLRFDDPAMTLPQILSALTIIVGAYSVTGPVHGSTMMLLALVLVFGIFNMKQKGAIIAGGYTVVLMGIAILIKIRTDPLNYPFKLEIAHFVLTAAIVPTISGLAAQLSSMRAKLQAQKDELANALVRIQVLATRDELTGLFNRRHMIEVLGQHRKRLERSGYHRFCLALLDIDHFKRINDTYGHSVGDEVLRNFAKVVQSGLRDTDVLARWGGEEFLVLLNDTSPELANVGLERARMLLADATLVPSLPDLKPTFSAGLTAYNMAEALDVCIERADRALYKAKDGGRNCTVIRMSATSGEVTDKKASPSSLEASELPK